MPASRHYFIQHACVSPFHGHLTTALLRLGVGLVPTAAAPSLQRFLLCSKPPSAACCTLFLARCERASMRRCPIGDCRGAVPTDGASQPPRVRAGRRTCPECMSRALGQPFLSPRGPTCSSSQLLRAVAAAAAGRHTELLDSSETYLFDYWVCGAGCAADPWCCEENENACKNRRLHDFHM